MLHEELLNKGALPFYKQKNYALTFIALGFMALIFAYYLNSHLDAGSDVQQTHFQKNRSINLYSRNIHNRTYPCPKRHKIAYIWTLGQMPDNYKDFVIRCKDNIIMLNDTHFYKYLKMWNDKHPQNLIQHTEKVTFNTRNDFLKRFYLYFEGGIYSDFDTEINQECWEGMITEQIIFTNSWGAYGIFNIPEQNFMKIIRPFHPHAKQLVIELDYEIRGMGLMGQRWDRCRMKQCFILFCQNHNSDNSWIGIEKEKEEKEKAQKLKGVNKQ